MRRFAFVVPLLFWPLHISAAQQTPIGAIEAHGEVTVSAQADYFDFTFTRTWTGDALATVATQALAFERTFLLRLEDREPKPLDVSVSGVAIPDARIAEVSRTARLRYPAGAYRGTGEGLVNFAKLCDALRELARELECELEGPVPGVNDPQIYEQAAIGQALTKTLPLADGGAGAMNAQILSVQTAKVSSIAWKRGEKDTEANKRQGVMALQCTVTVEVLYDFGTAY